MRNMLKRITFPLLVTVLLVATSLGCSPTATKGQSAAAPLKPGHWEGKPSVSFDVATGGKIRNYKMVAPFGVLASQTCTIQVDEIAAGPDGDFTIGESSKSSNYITGKFTNDSTFSGTFKIAACKGQGDKYTVVLKPEEKPWSAEWKRP